jgi:hypothetical protein
MLTPLPPFTDTNLLYIIKTSAEPDTMNEQWHISTKNMSLYV